jgi:hypothetical protein
MNNINTVELKINGETKYNSETDKNPGFQLNSVSANNNNNNKNNLDENGVDISKYTKVIQPDYNGQTRYWYNNDNGVMKEVIVNYMPTREGGDSYKVIYFNENYAYDMAYNDPPPYTTKYQHQEANAERKEEEQKPENPKENLTKNNNFK